MCWGGGGLLATGEWSTVTDLWLGPFLSGKSVEINILKETSRYCQTCLLSAIILVLKGIESNDYTI